MTIKGHIFLIAALLIGLSGCQSLIFHPEKRIMETPADHKLPYETISIQTKDKVKLSGWWIPAEKQVGVVLFFHGNGGNVSYFLEPVIVWNRMGLSTLIVDYRGYGLSEGRPSEAGTYLDADAAWEYLVRDRGIDGQYIIVYGKSLGGSIATWLAQDRTPGMLIVDSSFTSIATVAKELVPWLPSGLVLGNAYNTEAYLKKVKCPVLIIHSRNDEMISFRQGRQLFDAAGEPKELLILSGSHNGGFRLSLSLYEPGVKSFILKHLPR